jgi:hypothetical protein
MGAINKLSARQVQTFNRPGSKTGDGGAVALRAKFIAGRYNTCVGLSSSLLG